MLRNFLLVMLLLLPACSEQDRQSRLEQTTQELLEAINDHQAGDVMSYIAEHASWRPGWDRQRAQRTLFFYYRRYPTVSVMLRDTSYRWISDNEAVLTATAYTLGVSGARLDVRGNAYRVELRWFFHDGDWRITRIDWE